MEEPPRKKATESGKPGVSEGSVPVGTVKPVTTKGAEFTSSKCNLLPAEESYSDILSDRISELSSDNVFCLEGGQKVMMSSSVSPQRRTFSPLFKPPVLGLSCQYLHYLFFALRVLWKRSGGITMPKLLLSWGKSPLYLPVCLKSLTKFQVIVTNVP